MRIILFFVASAFCLSCTEIVDPGGTGGAGGGEPAATAPVACTGHGEALRCDVRR